MTPMKTFSLAAIVLSIIIVLSSMYTINEGEKGLLLRLGKISVDSKGQPAVKNPGLHFKWPFINTARIFDVRLQTLEIEASRIVTKNKKDVLVDSYVKWRIQNLPLYYTRTGGNEFVAEALLKQKVNNGLRAEFGRRGISEVVSGERADIMESVQDKADESAKGLGIEVVDVRIKGIDLPREVSSAVYDRMRAERERVATEHRAKGRSQAEAIRAKADARVTIVKATANGDAKRVHGEGDAKAAKIYADAYKKNPEFYAFLRSIQAYKTVFNNSSDVLILKPDSQFFQYFNNSKGKGAHKRQG